MSIALILYKSSTQLDIWPKGRSSFAMT